MIEFKFEHDGTEYDVEGRVVAAYQPAIIAADPSDCAAPVSQEVEFKFFLDGEPVDPLDDIRRDAYAHSALHWAFSQALEDQIEDDKEADAIERHENILLNGGW